MDKLKKKINIIEKLTETCQASQFKSFFYKDDDFSIYYNKQIDNSEFDINFKSNKHKTNKVDDSIKKIKYDVEVEHKKTTDVTTSENKNIIDANIVTLVSPFVGMLEFNKELITRKDGVFINKGDLVCTIEAMKIYNDILAPTSGEIIETLVKDHSLVEYEQPILKIRVDENEKNI